MADKLPQRKQHGRERPRPQRQERGGPESKRLYNDRRWKALSTRLREDAGWTCELCSKTGSSNTIVVDHITPHRGDLVMFWDTNNMQVICKQCHDTKTARGA